MVEQRTENPRVGGSIPSPGTGLSLMHKYICGCGSMVEHQPSKLKAWVRFPSPAWRWGPLVEGFFVVEIGFYSVIR